MHRNHIFAALSAHHSRRTRLAATAIAAIGLGLSAGPATAAAASATPPDASGNFMFRTIDDPQDQTFNQLLGINNFGTAAGYFGSGEKHHPNRGYSLYVNSPNLAFKSENYPGAAQTQVIGLNDSGITVGFWVDHTGVNSGFYSMNGRSFKTADYPTSDPAKPAVDQLLGVNDNGVAVGFYTNAKNVNYGYTYNIKTHRFGQVKVAGDTNVTAAGINRLGDIAGFASTAGGTTEAFLEYPGGKVVHLQVPGATMTQAFGVNDGDEVVGTYTVGSGNDAKTTGFVWSPGFGFESISDPNGIGSTNINGVNDHGKVVGFYTDANGNTDGFVAKPQS
jgi:hypothetical protein